jgi:hypothetical protein
MAKIQNQVDEKPIRPTDEKGRDLWSDEICGQTGLVLFRKPNGVASCCPHEKIVTG